MHLKQQADSLFHSIALPSQLPPAVFPAIATKSVINYCIHLPILDTYSESACKVQEQITLQLGVLPLLCNLKCIKLSVQIGHIIDLDNLELPLDSIKSAVNALCLLAPGASFEVKLKNNLDPLRQIQPIIPYVLGPLSGRTVIGLSLGFFRPDGAEDVRSAVSDEEWRGISQHLRHLKLDNSTWISPAAAQSNAVLLMPKLEELEVTMEVIDISFNMTHSHLSEMIPALAHCPNLRKLCIRLDNFESRSASAFPHTPLPLMKSSKLNVLDLQEAAFRYLGSAIAQLPCEWLKLQLEYDDDWHLIQTLLAADGNWLPQLRRLQILYVGFWPTDFRGWPLISKAARDRSIDLRISIIGARGLGPAPHIGQLLSVLRDTAEELVQIEFRIQQVIPFNASAAYGIADPVIMRRCRRLKISLADGFDQPEPGASTEAFRALMRQVNFPLLKRLEIIFISPFVDCLSSMILALRRGAYPRLSLITGSIATNIVMRGEKSWGGKVENAWLNEFRSECTRRKIRVDLYIH